MQAIISFQLQQYLPFTVLKLFKLSFFIAFNIWLQQYLPFTVCDEGGEAAEAWRDDEDRTSLVPDQREGETKRIEWKYLLIAVLKLIYIKKLMLYIGRLI